MRQMTQEDRVFFAKLILQQLRWRSIEHKEAKDRLIILALQGMEEHPMALEQANQYFDDAFQKLEENRDDNFYLMTENSSGSMLRYFDDEGEEEEEKPKFKEYVATFYKIKESWDEDGFSAESDREAIDHGHECAMNETNQDEGVEVVLDRLEEKVSRDKNRLVYERKARRLRG